MKKLTLLAAALALCASTAVAQLDTSSWYISTTGNLNWQNKTTIGNSVPMFSGYTLTDYNTGFGGAVALGTQLDENWRVELEGSYRRNNIKYNNKIFGDKMLGYRANTSVMANAFYDHPLSEKVKLYVGGGIGYSHAYYQLLGGSITDNVFAFQVMPGLSFAVCDNVEFTVGHRFFATTKTKIEDTLGSKMPYSNSVEAGFRFKF